MSCFERARRTAIVATLGPASASSEGIAVLLDAGVDVVRLNFSYGDAAEHRATIRRVRAAAHAAGRTVAILQDLRGPKIRLGRLGDGERRLVAGERVLLAAEPAPAGTIPVSYPHLAADVADGDRILLADGLVELRVVRRRGEVLEAEVLTGGTVSSHKGVNLPGSRLRVPSFTAKDRADLEVGLEEGVDLVALSFVRHEDDLAPVRACLARAAVPPLLVAKIEKPQAVERLDAILAVVDGVMVARGDLGVEMPLEEVPMIQKRIIAASRRAGRPVITATQMLRSMVDNPRPTRAEATDVANAVLDGTDAVMLSEETAVGRHPAEAVRVLGRIACGAEPHLDSARLLDEERSILVPPTAGAISRAACRLASEVGAVAIVAATASGSTARLVGRFRPPVPIIALTPDARVARQLALSWGVVPALVERLPDSDAMFAVARSFATEHGLARPGDRLVVTAGLPLHEPGRTNLVKIVEV